MIINIFLPIPLTSSSIFVHLSWCRWHFSCLSLSSVSGDRRFFFSLIPLYLQGLIEQYCLFCRILSFLLSFYRLVHQTFFRFSFNRRRRRRKKRNWPNDKLHSDWLINIDAMIPSPSHNRHRYNVKYFIRILVGLALTYIIGQLFQLTNAAPSRKYRLQKTTTNYG
jgi:hypothetical protein